MITIDELGSVVFWMQDDSSGKLVSLRSPSRRHRVPPKPTVCRLLGDQLWLFYVQNSSWIESPCELLVFSVDRDAGLRLVAVHGWKVHSKHSNSLGVVSCAAVVPAHPERVFLGHMQVSS